MDFTMHKGGQKDSTAPICPVCRSPRHVTLLGSEYLACQACGCRYRPLISPIIDQLEAERAFKMKTLEALLDEIRAIDDKIAGEQIKTQIRQPAEKIPTAGVAA